MSLKINVLPIIRDHLNTLYDNRDHRKGLDIVLFTVPPFIIAIGLSYLKPVISGNLLIIISTVFTIFTALLLSLLLLIFDMSGKIMHTGSNKNTEYSKNKAHILLVETKTNISFMILTSIASLFVILLLAIITESDIQNSAIIDLSKPALSFCSYLLLGIFGYTILMVLKRVYALLDEVLDINR